MPQGLPSWVYELPAAGQQLAPQIISVAQQHGLDPALFASMLWAESGFNAFAQSGAGAIGYSQLMPGTAQGLGVNPHNPSQNLQGGARYLQQQLEAFGSPELALAAYNAGPGRVRQAGNQIPGIRETQRYVAKVMEYLRLLGGGARQPSGNAMVKQSPQEVTSKLFDRMLAKQQAAAGVEPSPEKMVPAEVAPETVAATTPDQGGLREIGLAEEQAGQAEPTDFIVDDFDRWEVATEPTAQAPQDPPDQQAAWSEVPSYDQGVYEQARSQGLQGNAARGYAIARQFGFAGNIWGVGSRPNVSDHPAGNAIDVMVMDDAALGRQIADFFVAQAQALAVTYVIWDHQIWTPARGWHAYTGRNPHTDHPHISFKGD